MEKHLRYTYLSKPRYNKYLTATANNPERAKRLYHANIRLAQSFHPILSQFEVVLRNSLNIQLSAHFSDSDWIIHQRTGFMSDRSLSNSHYFLRTCILKSEKNLKRKHIPVTSGKIISDQTFGFWLSFFLPHHYSLVNGQPIHIFAHKPLSEDRARIYHKLDEIRRFRNRVNHCEPICFSSNNIDCSSALEIRAKLYDLIEWIDPKLIPFFEKADNIQRKIEAIMKI